MPIPPPYIPKVETPNIATMYLQGMMLKKEMDKQAADAEAAQQKLNIDTIRLGVEMEKLGIEKSKVATEERKNETYRLAAEKLGGANNPFNDLGVMFLSGGDPKAAHDWLNLGRSADKDTLDLIEQQASGLLAVYDKEGLPGYQKAKAALQGTYDPQVIERLLPASLENNPNQLRGVLSGIVEGKKKGVSVNIGGDNEFLKQLGNEEAKLFREQRTKAIDAATGLSASVEAKKLLNEGMITGSGANFIVGFGKALKQLGYDVGSEVDNSQAFLANQAQQVARIIKQFGAGTGLSDADREFSEKAAAGDITLTEPAIRRIIDINDRAARNIIEEYNKKARTIDERKIIPYKLEMDMPAFEVKNITKSPSGGGEKTIDYNSMTPEQKRKFRESLGK